MSSPGIRNSLGGIVYTDDQPDLIVLHPESTAVDSSTLSSRALSTCSFGSVAIVPSSAVAKSNAVDAQTQTENIADSNYLDVVGVCLVSGSSQRAPRIPGVDELLQQNQESPIFEMVNELLMQYCE